MVAHPWSRQQHTIWYLNNRSRSMKSTNKILQFLGSESNGNLWKLTVSKWKKEKAQVHQTEFKDNVINNAQQQPKFIVNTQNHPSKTRSYPTFTEMAECPSKGLSRGGKTTHLRWDTSTLLPHKIYPIRSPNCPKRVARGIQIRNSSYMHSKPLLHPPPEQETSFISIWNFTDKLSNSPSPISIGRKMLMLILLLFQDNYLTCIFPLLLRFIKI